MSRHNRRVTIAELQGGVFQFICAGAALRRVSLYHITYINTFSPPHAQESNSLLRAYPNS